MKTQPLPSPLRLIVSVPSRLLVCTLLIAFTTIGPTGAQGPVGLEPTRLKWNDAAAILSADTPAIAISPEAGPLPTRVLRGSNGSEIGQGFPFGPIPGGARIALGDLNNDGIPDIVAGMGRGGSLVQVFDGNTVASLGSGYPFGPEFHGGVFLATGDLNGDGRNDVAVSQGNGGGLVRVFSGIDYSLLLNVAPFGAGYAGGVTIAMGDLNGDGRSDLVAGQLSGALAAVIDGATGAPIAAGPPFGGGFNGGVFVAAGDVNGDGRADLILSPGAGGGSVVVFDLQSVSQLAALTPYGADFRSGVRVASGDIDGDGYADIITAPGPGGGNELRVFSGANSSQLLAVPAYSNNYSGGVMVAAPQASSLKFTSAAATTFSFNQPGSFTVRANGATAIASSGALPTGVTFTDNGNGTATLSGTPAAAGRFTLTFTATSNSRGSATQTFTLTVERAPQITSQPAASFAAGASGSFTVTSTGYPVPTITVSGALPAGVTAAPGANGTAVISGTPTGGAGSYPLTITATNGISPAATQAFVLTVTGAPAFTSAAATTFTVGTAASFQITTSAQPAVTNITRTGTLPTGITFTYNGNGTATLAGTPAAGSGGSYNLTFTATNGASTATQAFVLTVTSAPVFTSAAAATFNVGTAGSFQITTAAQPAVSNITRTGTLPPGVTFTYNGNGTATLAGTPAAGSGGTYNLTLTATNSVGTKTQAFVLTVTSAPVFTSAASTTFTAGVAGTFQITTSGQPTVTSITRSGTLPAGIGFTDNGNGTATLAGTASIGAEGTYPLTLTASNGISPAASQSFTLTVAASSCAGATMTPASGALTAGTYQTAYSQTFAPSLGTGYTFSVTGTPPPGLSLSSGGVLSGSPTNTGAYSFSVKATGGGCDIIGNYTLDVAPNAQNESYANGVGNTQYSVGAGTPSTPAVVVAGSVLGNDSGPGSLSAGPASIATAHGGQVALSANGSFLYTPQAGFAGPSDSFTYTLTDGNGRTDTATVTINLGGVVWYVNGAGAAGDGRSHSPFNSMAAASAAAQAGHVLYVHQGTPAGATTLKTGQTLWGSGAPFTLNGLVIPATSAPVIGPIALAGNVSLNAVSVDGGAGAAISGGAALTGTINLNAVSIVGGSTGLTLTGVNAPASVSATGGSYSGVTGAEVQINGGTANVAIGASIANSSGRSIDVQNRTGGTVSFAGAITDTAAGVYLSANTGATVTFSGGMSLSTGTNDAFTAIGGGTVAATQNNGAIVNTIVTTSGTALKIANTTIGAAGVTFRSISAGTAVATPGIGVILDNTGALAGLTVTGNASQGSGGLIRTKSGADGSLTSGIGIYLNQTANPSFNWMQLTDFDNSAIVGRSVNGFTLANSIIDGTSGSTVAQMEGPIVFGVPGVSGVNGVTGTVTFANSLISGGVEHNLQFYNRSGTMTLAFSGANLNSCQIADNSVVTGGDGLRLVTEQTATATVSLNTCRFRANRTRALSALAGDTSTLSVNVQASEVLWGAQGFVFSNAASGTMNAVVNGVVFDSVDGTSVWFGQSPGDASSASMLRGTLTGSTILPAAGNTSPGVLARLSSTIGQVSQARFLMQENFVQGPGAVEGILIYSPDAGTTPEYDVTLIANHVDMTDDALGTIGMDVRATQASPARLCANLLSNLSHHPSTAPGGGMRVEQSNGAQFLLEQGASTLATPPLTVLQDNQHFLTGVTLVGTPVVVANGSCRLP